MLGLLLVSACFADASAANYVVIVKDMTFGKVPARLAVGDTVTWKNEDIFRHTATDQGGAFDLRLDEGKSGSVMLRKSGTFRVVCRYHPGMTMRLSVRK